jgi:predicted amidohydrolase
MICYDRECPESARALMLGGAEVILVPNSCTLDPLRRAQLQVRAFENMVGVAMANNAAPQADGHSVAFHPVAYQDGRPRDTLVIAAGETEGVYVACFDLTEIRAYRRRETWGNAFRRPRHYAALTAPEVRPPFLRLDRCGGRWDRRRRDA